MANEGHQPEQSIFYATKVDLAELRTELEGKATKLDLAELRTELEGKIAEVQISLARLEGRMTAWGTVFVALWALTVAILSAILKGVL